MTDPLIHHICTCGYYLENDTAAERKWCLKNKGFARIFHPCSKCLKSQAEGFIEAIEEERKIYNGIFQDDSAMKSAVEGCIKIIKEGAGL